MKKRLKKVNNKKIKRDMPISSQQEEWNSYVEKSYKDLKKKKKHIDMMLSLIILTVFFTSLYFITNPTFSYSFSFDRVIDDKIGVFTGSSSIPNTILEEEAVSGRFSYDSIKKYVNDSLVLNITDKCRRWGDSLSKVHCVDEQVKSFWFYNDTIPEERPQDKNSVIPPSIVLSTGGVCRDMVVLVGSVLNNLGIPYQVVRVNSDNVHHVFLVAKPPLGEGNNSISWRYAIFDLEGVIVN